LPQRRGEFHRCEQWQKSHHGARTYNYCRTIGSAKPVIVEAVLLVPKLTDRGGNHAEMLEELDSYVLVRMVVVGEAQCHFEHVQAEFGHPGRAVGLLEQHVPG